VPVRSLAEGEAPVRKVRQNLAGVGAATATATTDGCACRDRNRAERRDRRGGNNHHAAEGLQLRVTAVGGNHRVGASSARGDRAACAHRHVEGSRRNDAAAGRGSRKVGGSHAEEEAGDEEGVVPDSTAAGESQEHDRGLRRSRVPTFAR